jgi:hypothetical protein
MATMNVLMMKDEIPEDIRKTSLLSYFSFDIQNDVG